MTNETQHLLPIDEVREIFENNFLELHEQTLKDTKIVYLSNFITETTDSTAQKIREYLSYYKIFK